MSNDETIPGGVWPVMVTPFRENRDIDWSALDALIDWYLAAGVSGLFAVCLSSEMFDLDAGERERLARHVVERAGAQVPVVATGTFGQSIDELAGNCERMAGTGVAATVWLTNALAPEGDGESTWVEQADTLHRRTAGVPFGLYECPVPYKRLLETETVAWAAATEHCLFLKDTSCQLSVMTSRLAALQGTSLKLFNANAESLLPSMVLGADGFCGISANFFPDLWVWLCRFAKSETDSTTALQAFLSRAEQTIIRQYPMTAKYYLDICGVAMRPVCRSDDAPLSSETKEQLLTMKRQADDWREQLGLKT